MGYTMVCCTPILVIQKDERYEDHDQFDGFRYVRLQRTNGDSPKYHAVNTNLKAEIRFRSVVDNRLRLPTIHRAVKHEVWKLVLEHSHLTP